MLIVTVPQTRTHQKSRSTASKLHVTVLGIRTILMLEYVFICLQITGCHTNAALCQKCVCVYVCVCGFVCACVCVCVCARTGEVVVLDVFVCVPT